MSLRKPNARRGSQRVQTYGGQVTVSPRMYHALDLLSRIDNTSLKDVADTAISEYVTRRIPQAA